jgi:hypothetical protein
MAAEKLLDLSQPIDVPLLDATVAAFYGTGSKEQVYLRFHSTFSSISLTNFSTSLIISFVSVRVAFSFHYYFVMFNVSK